MLTDNETWEKCIAMWEWIVDHLGMEDLDLNEYDKTEMEDHVGNLKETYITDVLCYPDDLDADCFFCQAACEKSPDGMCCDDDCPGNAVDGTFNCCNPRYCYNKRPRAFLKELKRLDAIRRKEAL